MGKWNMMGGIAEGRTEDRECMNVGGGVRPSSDLRMITTVMPAMPRFFCAPPWRGGVRMWSSRRRWGGEALRR